MSRTTTHDVVVVGARAAGAATALLLARAGLDVLVVDRSRYGADTLSTHALMRGGVVQLHRWGLLDAVVAAGTPAVRRTTFTYADGDDVTITIKPSHGVDALYAPRRTVLDPILVDAARGAGADVRYGVTVTGVTRDRRGRVDGIVADDGRDEVHHRARWVVGADGVRSVVASAVGAAVERSGVGATAVVYGYWRDLPADGYRWIYRPGAFAGLIPTNDGETCVFAAGHRDRVGRGGLDALQAIVRAASPALAAQLHASRPPTGVRSFAGMPGYLRTPWGEGWALVGDAGYWKDPISTHGITDALRDAELLARALTATADGDLAEVDALTTFHQTRDRLSLPVFEVVDTIAAMRWREDEISGLLRQLSSAMSDEVEHVTRFPDVEMRPA